MHLRSVGEHPTEFHLVRKLRNIYRRISLLKKTIQACITIVSITIVEISGKIENFESITIMEISREK